MPQSSIQREEDTADALRPVRLTCEHLTDPLGLDEPSPRLGWAIEGEGHDRWQSGYEIRVAADLAGLAGTEGLAWHVPRCSGPQTLDHSYAGEALKPRTRYWWSVRCWDEREHPSAFAEPAWFETGLMGGAWPAQWLRGPVLPFRLFTRTEDRPYRNRDGALPVVHFRRAFRIGRPVARARLYATALGVYEARINGRRVGDALLAPGWTDYARRLDYQSYDVTPLLRPGDNVLGFLLGEGWYSGYLGFNPLRRRNIYGRHPEILGFLALGFEDGTEEVVATGPGWLTSRGPRLYSDLLKGECFDARRAVPGWDGADFDDESWTPAGLGKGTSAVPCAQRAPPVRVIRGIAPIAATLAPDGTWVFDMGQNLVGRVRVDVSRLEAGQQVRLRHAEMLQPDGSLYTANLRTARAEDLYTAGAGQAGAWEPLFTIHGFRYVGVSGLRGAPPLDMMQARVINSDLPETASFKTSNPMLNQLWSNILWSQRGNVLSVPTDCPQRDERLGWMADVQIFLPTAAINMDLRAFMAKWMDDVLDAQSPAGAFSDVSPRGPHNFDGAPAWGDAGVIVPATLYRLYGDRRLLERCYPAMRRWTALIAKKNPDLVRTRGCGWNFGDWLSAGEATSKPLVATAYWALVLRHMTEAAGVLGHEADRERYEEVGARVADAFRRRFVGPGGSLDGDTQTAYLLALAVGLLRDEDVAGAIQRLVANVERRGVHIATGFLGVRHILPVLTRHGHADLAYRLALQTSYPSWLYPIGHGATTVWERWDGWTADKGFQSARMNSFNHYALGSIGEWLMNTVAGIVVQPFGSTPSLELAPVPGEGVDWCEATQVTPSGPVRADWRRTERGLSYRFEVPANRTARIALPLPAGARLTREGAATEPDRICTRNGLHCAILDVGSGHHAFGVTWSQQHRLDMSC